MLVGAHLRLHPCAWLIQRQHVERWISIDAKTLWHDAAGGNHRWRWSRCWPSGMRVFIVRFSGPFGHLLMVLAKLDRMVPTYWMFPKELSGVVPRSTNYGRMSPSKSARSIPNWLAMHKVVARLPCNLRMVTISGNRRRVFCCGGNSTKLIDDYHRTMSVILWLALLEWWNASSIGATGGEMIQWISNPHDVPIAQPF